MFLRNGHFIINGNDTDIAHLTWNSDGRMVGKYAFQTSGPGCSKLTTSLVNVSLKF